MELWSFGAGRLAGWFAVVAARFGAVRSFRKDCGKRGKSDIIHHDDAHNDNHHHDAH